MIINSVKEIEDGYLVNSSLVVPNSQDNRHFKEVQKWIAAGNTPEPPTEPTAPQAAVITRRQGRLALLQAGKLDLVETGIAAIVDETERRAAQIEYEADTWELENQFLRDMWAQLEGTEQELKDLFNVAATL